MDKTTQDIIKLYEEIIRLGIGCYISQYHVSLINRWNDMLIRNDCSNDEFKTIRNLLYGLFILLIDSINSRSAFIDFCLETIKTHNDNSIATQYGNLRELFDNFPNINNLSDVDYSNVVELLSSLYNCVIVYHDRGTVNKYIALILRKYDMTNRYITNVISLTPKQEVDLDDVLISIYGK